MKSGLAVYVFLALATVTLAAYHRRAPPSCQRFATAVADIVELSMADTGPGRMPARDICKIKGAVGYFYGIEDRDDVEALACIVGANLGDAESLFRALDAEGVVDSTIRHVYDHVVASFMSELPPFVRDDASGRIQQQCPTGTADEIASIVNVENLINLFRTVEDLGLLGFDKEGTRLLGSLVVRDAVNRVYFPDTCGATEITNKAERCRLVKEAFSAVWSQALTNPNVAMGMRFMLGMVLHYTGIDLVTDLQNAAPNLACKVGEIQNLADLRSLVEELGVRSVGLPLVYGGLLQGMSIRNTLAQAALENPEPYSENALVRFRADVELWNAAQELIQGSK